MAVKSSPRGKRSKPHCLEAELVSPAKQQWSGGVQGRAAAVHGGADSVGEALGAEGRNQGRGAAGGAQGTTKGVMGRGKEGGQRLERAGKAGRKRGRSCRHAGQERLVKKKRAREKY